QQLIDEGNEKINCDFNGEMKKLNDHVDNSCPLNLLDCWYKPFGCAHECTKQKLQEHLTLKLKFHFDLVVKFVDSLKKTIKLNQDEIIQLKLKIELNEKKYEENRILINENISMELKKKEFLEKDNEIKKLEKELIKLRDEIERLKGNVSPSHSPKRKKINRCLA
ncbi:hypothetical protein RFI_37894, partial [Reticulomyxa filosa]